MKYYQIKKEIKNKPKTGDYSDWKHPISVECKNQCVYCTIIEKKFGGIRNFHVEHYRPKSLFPALENEWSNLFFSCSICNCFKSNDWPNEPDNTWSQKCYPDPSQIDYSTILEWSEKTNYKLEGKNISANYIIEKLFLNRPQLLLERKEYTIINIIFVELTNINNLIDNICNSKITDSDLCNLFRDMAKMYFDLLADMNSNYIPYTESQVKRS
ncbi:MAG: HNH endonuclease [Ignavibacteria bacterium]